ncbi:MAG TPA: hypothetical protein VLL97_10055 [Acidobacteriota bacterium]|nr:hypothetical protein [Acidobacteriota bacterium]
MTKRLMFTVIALACCFGLIACSPAKAPTEAAIKATEEALAGIKNNASVYVPDQLKAVEDSLAAAKESFQKGEYQQALTAAKELPAKAKDLATAVASKKDELTKSWQDMSGTLPGMVETIQQRVNDLSKSRRLPAGIDTAKFEAAKSDLAAMTQTWTEATSAFTGGNLMDAVTKANTVKGKAAEIMNALGMKAPEAAMK